MLELNRELTSLSVRYHLCFKVNLWLINYGIPTALKMSNEKTNKKTYEISAEKHSKPRLSYNNCRDRDRTGPLGPTRRPSLELPSAWRSVSVLARSSDHGAPREPFNDWLFNGNHNNGGGSGPWRNNGCLQLSVVCNGGTPANCGWQR